MMNIGFSFVEALAFLKSINTLMASNTEEAVGFEAMRRQKLLFH